MSPQQDRALKITSRLQEAYPDAGCGLNHRNVFELLIATILSAQCTDKRVNIITEQLFAKYPTPLDFAQLTPMQLAEDIKGCGLHRNKSNAIVSTCRILLEKHQGKVPETREELESLPGVGRKTAGVVLGVGFGQATLPVDTHVHRIAGRLGLANAKNPEQTEQQLMQCLPASLWQPAHHLFIAHGRQTCAARNPRCLNCPVPDFCILIAERES